MGLQHTATSQSLRDVAEVAKSNLPRARWLETHEVVRSTQPSSQTACQEHENEPAEVVIVCEPEGTSLMMGGLHPRCVSKLKVPITLSLWITALPPQ